MSETTSANLAGRCRCGAWRFDAAAEPFQVSYCHCTDCRRATGAPVTVFAGFRHDDIEANGEEPAEYSAVPGVSRLFCRRCGTPVGYRTGCRARSTSTLV